VFLTGSGRSRTSFRGEHPRQILGDTRDVERPGHSQRPGKRSPPLSHSEAVRIRMDPCSPAVDAPSTIENQVPVHNGYTQQLTGSRPRSATNTSAHRA
jgi:hypothetical protein